MENSFFGIPQVRIVAHLPVVFNLGSMRHFINEAIEKRAATKANVIVFDFTVLNFIEPEGIVALANTIETFRAVKVRIIFHGHNRRARCIKYLDDSGFFRHYLGGYLFTDSARRATTMPLHLFDAKQFIQYLYYDLTPWIAQSVNLSTDTMETIRACLEEVFYNVAHHSEARNGFVFAQHFPRAGRICIAISDFGIGIPTRVRTKEPRANDAEALNLAITEGWTTKTDVRNRGVGLPTLLKYITQRNGGGVTIHSGLGCLRAGQGAERTETATSILEWKYPGTLVHVVLRTDTLERLEDDAAQEDFQWNQSA